MRAIMIKEVRSRSGWKPEGEVITSSYGGGLFPANDAIEKLKKWCNFEKSALAGDILIIERDIYYYERHKKSKTKRGAHNDKNNRPLGK